jgi:glycosyltransferase involved in cell wall biosynthesis
MPIRVVYFAPRFPLPATGGDRLLTEQYLRLLGPRWDLHFLAFEEGRLPPRELVDELRESCGLASVTVLPLGLSRVFRAASLGLRGLPLQAGYYYDPRAARVLSELIQGIAPDVILLQTVRLLPYLEAVPPQVKRVVHFVDALSKNYARSARWARGPIRRLLYAHEHRRLVALEKRALRQAEVSFVVSARDQEYLNRLRGGNDCSIHVVPLGIDTRYFQYRPGASVPRYNVGFLGRMSTRANEDAAVWFAKEVLPVLSERLGYEVRFTVIGAEPSRRVRELQSSNVVVTGHVPDIRPLIWDTDLTVAPMRISSGIQFKILQSLALGRPVVASRTALDGLGNSDIPGVFLAEGVEATVDQIVTLYEDFQGMNLVMPQANKRVAEHFSSGASSVCLAEFVEHLVSPNGAHMRGPAQRNPVSSAVESS